MGHIKSHRLQSEESLATLWPVTCSFLLLILFWGFMHAAPHNRKQDEGKSRAPHYLCPSNQVPLMQPIIFYCSFVTVSSSCRYFHGYCCSRLDTCMVVADIHLTCHFPLILKLYSVFSVLHHPLLLYQEETYNLPQASFLMRTREGRSKSSTLHKYNLILNLKLFESSISTTRKQRESTFFTSTFPLDLLVTWAVQYDDVKDASVPSLDNLRM